jgi:predicted transcriptional regulator
MSQKLGLTVKEFADLIRVGECTVYRWISEDAIQYVNCRIPKGYANRVKRLWDKTCTPSEFARHLGVSPSKVDLLIVKGKLRSIRVIRKPRLFLKDLRKIKNDPNLVQKCDVIHKNKRGFARYTKKRKTAIALLGCFSPNRKKKENKLQF